MESGKRSCRGGPRRCGGAAPPPRRRGPAAFALAVAVLVVGCSQSSDGTTGKTAKEVDERQPEPAPHEHGYPAGEYPTVAYSTGEHAALPEPIDGFEYRIEEPEPVLAEGRADPGDHEPWRPPEAVDMRPPFEGVKGQGAPPPFPSGQGAPRPEPILPSPPGAGPGGSGAPRPRADGDAFVAVDVFYGTDRRFIGSAAGGKAYGGERGELEYGRCLVSIPKNHQPGWLESPKWYKLEFNEDPARHVVLLGVARQDPATFVEGLRRESAGSRRLLVFVHGYNVSFEDAARRTAQMAFDLAYEGVPVLYSWPSEGDVSGYVADEADNEWTRPHFTEFLTRVTAAVGAERLDIIAHSMGARAVASALADIGRSGAPPCVNQVILAAPDIDADVFRDQIAPSLRKACGRLTLYASADDRAIQASRQVHKSPRAGESGPHLFCLEGIDTIDASGVDTSTLGHSYFSTIKVVLDDIAQLVSADRTPEARGLLRRTRDPHVYWAFPR